MPRVNEKTKSTRGQEYKCAKCGKPIVAGRKYYEWAFRFGGTHRQHAKCGRPRQSQLTQSKMSGAYSTQEGLQDLLNKAQQDHDLSGVADALREAASDIESVRDEYQDSLDNMPDGLQQGDTGQQIQEKIDALDNYANELNSAADDVDSAESEIKSLSEDQSEKTEAEVEAEPPSEEQADAANTAIESALDAAETAADGLEV